MRNKKQTPNMCQSNFVLPLEICIFYFFSSIAKGKKFEKEQVTAFKEEGLLYRLIPKQII